MSKKKEEKKPPQERKPNNRGTREHPVAIRYEDKFFENAEVTSRTPLSDLLAKKLNQVVCVEIDGEPVQAPAKEIITSHIISLAMDGDKWAIQFLFDRIEGKAVDRIGFNNGNSNSNLPVTLCEFFYGGAYGQYANNKKANGKG